MRRGAPLCAPAMTERRRLLGLQRYETNRQLREGLAVGQAMARSGRLLELSHGAQPKGSARAETRRRAGERTAPVRQRTSAAAMARLHARLIELGFAEIWGAICATGTSAGDCRCWRWHVSWALGTTAFSWS